VIEEALKGISTLQCERIVPPIANRMPHLIISWDEKRLGLTRQQLTNKLFKGEPPIQIGRVSGTGDKGVLISVFMLQDGEDRVVAERLRSLLKKGHNSKAGNKMGDLA